MQEAPVGAGSAARDLRSASDPTRLGILRLLLDSPSGRLGVTDLADRLGLRQPTVSHHLRVLEDDGLIVRQAEGRHRFASIAPDRLATILTWLDATAPTESLDPAVAERIISDLADRFSGVFSRETVDICVRDSADLLARRPRTRRHLSSLTAQFAADRLAATARADLRSPLDHVPDVLFVCVQNAGRSQLAAAILRFVGATGCGCARRGRSRPASSTPS